MKTLITCHLSPLLFIINIRVFHCIILVSIKYRPNRHEISSINLSASAFGQTIFPCSNIIHKNLGHFSYYVYAIGLNRIRKDLFMLAYLCSF